MPPKFGNAFSQQKELARKKQEMNTSLETNKSGRLEAVSKSIETNVNSPSGLQVVPDSPRTTFDMFAGLVPPIPESPDAKEDILLSSVPRRKPRRQSSGRSKISGRSFTDPTAFEYHPRQSAIPEPLFQSKQALKSMERFLPKFRNASKENPAVLASPTPPTASSKAIEILGGSANSSASSKRSQESSQSVKTPSKIPDPYRISCSSDDLRPLHPVMGFAPTSRRISESQKPTNTDQRAAGTGSTETAHPKFMGAGDPEALNSTPAVTALKPEDDSSARNESDCGTRERVKGIILGNSPLSPTIQGHYATTGSAKIMNAMRIKSSRGIIMDPFPSGSQVDALSSSETIHCHDLAPQQTCSRSPDLNVPPPPLPVEIDCSDVQFELMHCEPTHSSARDHFQMSDTGPWEDMHQRHPDTMPYYTHNPGSQSEGSQYSSPNSPIAIAADSSAKGSSKGSGSSSTNYIWLPFLVPTLAETSTESGIDQERIDLEATPRKVISSRTEAQAHSTKDSTESVEVHIESTPPSTSQPTSGGYAPTPQHASYQSRAPLEQQLAYHFSLMQNYFHAELQKLNRHVENSTNRILDEVLNHIDVRLTPDVQQSIRLAQETKSIAEQTQNSLSALSKGMQSDVRALKALHADMFEQTRNEFRSTTQMLAKHDGAVKKQVHETVADMVDEHIRPLQSALSISNAPKRKTGTTSETDPVGSLLQLKGPPSFPNIETLRAAPVSDPTHGATGHGKAGVVGGAPFPPAARALPPPPPSAFPGTPTRPSRFRNQQQRGPIRPPAARGINTAGLARHEGEGLLGGAWYNHAYGHGEGK